MLNVTNDLHGESYFIFPLTLALIQIQKTYILFYQSYCIAIVEVVN
jgi:hypothetical protein